MVSKMWLLTFSIILLSCTQTILSIMTQKEKDKMVLDHNVHRTMILKGKVFGQPKALSMPNMTWDTRLEAKAQYHAEQCIFEHDTKQFRQIPGYDYVGQNLAYLTLKGEVFHMWFDEHYDYDFKTGSCKKGKLCGHYTQVVWNASVLIGCGKHFCPNLSDGQGAYLWTCNYAPGGNNWFRPYEVDPTTPLIEENEPLDKKIIEKNLMSKEEKEEIVKEHNYYRKGLRDGQVVKFPKAEKLNLLSWDTELEAKATEYGLQCKFWRQHEIERNSTHYKTYGQNVFGCWNQKSFPTATWWRTEKFYDYATNKATKDTVSNFKQLAWYESSKIGCYRGTCNDVKIVICNYDKNADYEARPYPETLEGTYNEKVGSKYSVGSSEIMIEQINEFRQEVKNGEVVGWPKSKEMSTVAWNRDLAVKAQSLASQCKEDYSPVQEESGAIDAHSIDISYPYMRTWKDYSSEFDYGAPCSGKCLKYTILITAKADKVGCGYEVCPALGKDKHVHVCLFNKKANPNGKPYEVDESAYKAEVGSDLSYVERMKLLSLHNSFRRMAMRGEIFKQPKAAKMPLVKWNADLAREAQKDLNPCQYRRYPNDASLPGVGNYVHLFSFFRKSSSAENTIRSWFKYKWSYQYSSNYGSYSAYKYKILVNSQITQIGCAVKNCPKTWGGINFIKCNYADITFNQVKNNRPYEAVEI